MGSDASLTTPPFTAKLATRVAIKGKSELLKASTTTASILNETPGGGRLRQNEQLHNIRIAALSRRFAMVSLVSLGLGSYSRVVKTLSAHT